MLTEVRHVQRGAATVEFYIVAMLGLLPLCLGFLQVALLLVANHHVDHAAFMAARQGAVRNGNVDSMRREFARVLTPMFVSAESDLNAGNVTARVLAAYARAIRDMTVYGRVELLSPDARVHRDFIQEREGRQVIPNDSLEHRSAAPGALSRVSLQEANMLRARFSFCQPLIVPFARQFLLSLLRRIDLDPWNQHCYAAGRVPIVSIGIAPMQSDFIVTIE